MGLQTNPQLELALNMCDLNNGTYNNTNRFQVSLVLTYAGPTHRGYLACQGMDHFAQICRCTMADSPALMSMISNP